MATSHLIYPPPSGVHRNCVICDQNFHSVKAQRNTKFYKAHHNDAQAQLLLQHLMQMTKKTLEHVKSVLQSHGDIILLKWKKSSKEKRASLLEASEMFKSVTQLAKSRTDPWGTERVTEAHFQWLDVSKLADDGMQLLSLLQVRTRYEPHEWAAFDARWNLLAFRNPIMEHVYNPKAVIMHGEQYGTLTEMDVDSLHSWVTVGFPRALGVFHAQNHIADMLRSFVDKLTAGAEPTGSSKWTALVATGLHSTGDDALWSPYHHVEFTPPQSFDPGAMLEKARTHLNNLVDEMEIMQTSPEHLHQYVMRIRSSILIDRAEDQKRMSAEGQWTWIAQDLSVNWTNQISVWQRIVSVIEDMKRQVASDGNHIVKGSRLSGEADIAIRCFGQVIKTTLEKQNEECDSQLRRIAEMRDHFSRIRPHTKYDPVRPPQGSLKDVLDPSKQDDRISVAAGTLRKAIETDNNHGAGVAWYVQRLRLEAEGFPCDQLFENWLSGVALLDEFYVAWRWRQTYAPRSSGDPHELSADIRTRDVLSFSSEPAFALQARLKHATLGDLRCGRKLQDFCESPLPESPKNLAWVKRMTESRRCLTSFWDSVRSTWRARQSSAGKSESFIADMLPLMSFDIGPVYLAEVAEERQRIEDEDQRMKESKRIELVRKQQQARQQQVNTPFVQQDWDVGGKDNGTAVRRNMTRKTNAARMETPLHDDFHHLNLAPDAAVDAAVDAQSASPSINRIAVRQDTLSVISRMFPVGADSPHGVRWNALVKALKDAGLVATQGAGSAVCFSNQHGSVSFHEPHPDDMVDAIRLRGFGKRLRKWFGWSNETFVLRRKVSEGAQGAVEAT